MRKVLHELDPYDKRMFEEMKGKYVSENERFFFETMQKRMQYEFSEEKEIVLNYDDNPDEVYMYREDYYLFTIGRITNGIESHSIETFGLFNILEIDLYEKLFPGHITLWEWLRSNDYKWVKYNTKEIK